MRLPACLVSLRRLFLLGCLASGLVPGASAATGITDVGGIARPFQIVNRLTGGPINLADFADQVLVLDFFAYWCGPCRASSPDLDANVKDWYAARGGNAHGVPVTVLPVNVEPDDESATDQFVRQAGLEEVANDYRGNAYYQFATGFIPLFVIINGVAESPSHNQWEVLYRDSGYPGAPFLRSIIDRVQPSNRPRPPSISRGPTARTLAQGSTLRLEVQATGKGPLAYAWLHDGRPIPGQPASTNAYVVAAVGPEHSGRYQVRVVNEFGSVLTSPVDIRVIGLGAPKAVGSSTTAKAIPDNNPVGATSTLAVSGTDVVGRVRVSFKIQHAWPSDLRVTLRGPDQQAAVVFDREDVVGTVLEVKDRTLTTWGGANVAGTWSLVVTDLESEDTGSLISWSLAIEPIAPEPLPPFAQWIAGFPGLAPEQRLPQADPDLDGYPNLVEYRLHGRSPIVAERHPVWYPNGSGQWECVYRWRDGMPHQGASLWWTDDLGSRPWSKLEPGQTGRPTLDASQSYQTIVRSPAANGRAFLLLKYDPGLD